MTFGNPARHYASCASTNDLARVWASNSDRPAPDGSLVTTDYQTRGRGRRGRGWNAERGKSVLMSIVLRPDHGLETAWQLGFTAALATATALDHQGVIACLKWPNDVLLHGGKLAGVLVETAMTSQEPGWCAIVGIGVNINQEKFDTREAFLFPPTSVRIETGASHSIPDTVDGIVAAFGQWETIRRQPDGWQQVLQAWRTRMATELTLHRGDETGILLDVLDDGAASVRLADGTFMVWRSVEGEEAVNSV